MENIRAIENKNSEILECIKEFLGQMDVEASVEEGVIGDSTAFLGRMAQIFTLSIIFYARLLKENLNLTTIRSL